MSLDTAMSLTLSFWKELRENVVEILHTFQIVQWLELFLLTLCPTVFLQLLIELK